MNNTFTILEGNFLDVGKRLPTESVHVCVTSPPYYGLRTYQTEPQIWLPRGEENCQKWAKASPLYEPDKDYHRWQPIKQYKDSWRRGESSAQFHSNDVGARRSRSREETRDGRWTCTEYCQTCEAWRGELGQEPSPELYIQHLIEIFAVVHRALRPDGTLLVNIGDAYYNYRPGKHDDARAQGYNRQKDGNARDIPSFTAKRGYKLDGYKEKDLMLIPWQFAIAMRQWGWYVRSAIVWCKPNPLSESVTDRPTNNWEPVLMFAKSENYYWDKWAITEKPTGNAHPRGRMITLIDQDAAADVTGEREKLFVPHAGKKQLNSESRNNSSFRAATAGTLSPGGRNRRSVWTINVQGYSEDHYAAYPEELAEIPIKAGTSAVGCCRQCATPWRRIVLKPAKPLSKDETLEARWRRSAREHGIDIDNAVTGDSITLGWRRGCKCLYPGAPVPCTVLDPFAGRGTTGVVAVRFGRNFYGVELQPRYIPMIRKNITQESPLWVKEDPC